LVRELPTWWLCQSGSALAINPDAARVRPFLALDASEPVVFVNLHRYREQAQYQRVTPASIRA
jgi:hypothetical protein